MMHRIRLAPKLALVLLVFATTIVVVLGLLSFNSGRKALHQAAVAHLVSNAAEKKAELTDFIVTRRNDLTSLSNTSAVRAAAKILTHRAASHLEREFAGRRLNDQFAPWFGPGRQFHSIMLLRARDGAVLAASHQRDLDRFKEDRHYFREGKIAPFVQGPYFSISLRQQSIAVSTPVRNRGGKLLAVLVARLEMNTIRHVVGRRAGGYVTDDTFLVNRAGLPVTRPRTAGNAVVLERDFLLRAIRPCFAGQSGVVTAKDFRDVTVISAYRWLDEYSLCLLNKIDAAEALKPSDTLGWRILVVAAVVLVLAGMVGYILSRIVTEPISKIRQGVQRIAAGELDHRLPEKSEDEVGELARDVNAMTKALQESDERFARTVLGTNDGLWDWNINGREDYFSPRCAEFLGYATGELPLRMRTFVELMHPTDRERMQTAVQAHLQNQKPYDIELRLRHKNGTYVWVRSRGRVFRDKDGEPERMAGSITDITELKLTEENLRLALIDAERANEAKSEFLATMSHELRTPLNAIIGFSETMMHQYFGELGSPKYREYADDIHASGEHLLQLVNDILDISAIEAGEHHLNKEWLTPEDVVDACVPIIADAAEKKDIDFVIGLTAGAPPIYADDRALKQILLNLLYNAVKFTHDGGSIELNLRASNGRHVWTISDTGIGVPKKKLPFLTKPFVKSGGNSYASQEGTGLGLAIVKSLTDLHGGDLDIDSVVGKGTTVTISLPSGQHTALHAQQSQLGR